MNNLLKELQDVAKEFKSAPVDDLRARNGKPPYEGNPEPIIAALKERGVVFEGNEDLEKAVKVNIENSDKFSTAFSTLKFFNVSYENNSLLSLFAILCAEHADKFAISFEVFKNAGIDYDANPDLCRIIVLLSPVAVPLGAAYDLLKTSGFTYQRSPELYEAVINHTDEPVKKVHAVIALRDSGIPYEGNSAFYVRVASSSDIDASQLVAAFAILKSAGIEYENNKEFYEQVIQRAWYLKTLTQAYTKLKEAGILHENVKLYQIVTTGNYNAVEIASLLVVLHRAGFSYDKYTKMYDTISQSFVTKFYNSIIMLHAAGITEQHARFYQTVIDQPWNCEDLASAFAAFYREGFSIEEDNHLFEAVKANPSCFVSFIVLKKCGIATEHRKLYQAIIDNNPSATELRDAFVALHAAGFVYSEHQALYDAIILKINRNLADDIISLNSMGFSKEDKKYYEVVVFDVHKAAGDFVNALEIMKKADLSRVEHAKLYEAIIQERSSPVSLARAFGELVYAGFSYVENAKFFETVTQEFQYAIQLSVAFEILRKAGCAKDVRPYQIVIDNPSHARKLSIAFATMLRAGFRFTEHSQLYAAITKNPVFGEEMATAFETLKVGGILPNNTGLYQKVMDEPSMMDAIAPAFAALCRAGFSYEENDKLYQAIYNKPLFLIKQLAVAFTKMKEAGISHDRVDLYQTVIAKAQYLNPEFRVLELMKAAGVTYKRFPAFYNKFILIKHEEYAAHAFNVLSKYNISDHKQVFERVLLLLSEEHPRFQVINALLQELRRYASSTKILKPGEKDYDEQQRVLDNLVKEKSETREFAYGPLVKSWATTQIEALLEVLSLQVHFDNMDIIYENSSYYILRKDHQKLNLSLLLNNANLSHLTLSDEIIKRLGLIIKPLLKKWFRYANPVIDLLPETQQVALSCYIYFSFKNINNFFRSEAFDESDVRLIVVNDTAYQTRVNFILGCLINDAVNKIPALAEVSLGDRRVKDVLLDRKESLTDEDIQRRNANPWTFPALTSFSAAKDGSALINPTKRNHTKLTNGHGYIINEDEAEIIFPHGTQVVTQRIKDGFSYATIVCTPELAQNHYFSEVALEYAFNNHLRHEYKDEQSKFTLEGVEVVRGNHGAPHVYNVQLNIAHVVNYFAHFAKDEDFKKFCQQLSDDDQESLRIAAAFSVSGREGESSFQDDEVKYKAYKKASVENFIAFVDIAKTTNPFMKDCMTDNEKNILGEVLQHLGNPKYETDLNTQTDQELRKRANYYSRILMHARDLDLIRCYRVHEFLPMIKKFNDASVDSPKQQAALLEMLRYSIELLKIHGNAQKCDLKPNGEWVDVQIPYRAPFQEVSTSLKRLAQITQMVPRPVVTLTFQFHDLVVNPRKRVMSEDDDNDVEESTSKKMRKTPNLKRKAENETVDDLGDDPKHTSPDSLSHIPTLG